MGKNLCVDLDNSIVKVVISSANLSLPNPRMVLFWINQFFFSFLLISAV